MSDSKMSTGVGSLGVNRTVYEFDYFSGSQIGIYVGDVLVDDVDSIQFTVTQTKRPIYGYASQYFHTVADGQVLVEGTFAIPFKEADYILAVLSRFRETSSPIDEALPLLGLPGVKASPTEYLVERENIERRMMNAAKKDLPDYEMIDELVALPDEAFERVAEVFEDTLWKKNEENFLTDNLPPGVRKHQNPSNLHRRADQYPPVDIYILYGDIANAAANHTIKKLIGVSIVGQGQAINVGGEPTREQYRFIAKNLG